jgi:hypothetical protein
MNQITSDQIQKIFGWRKQYAEFFIVLLKALLACFTISPTVLSAYTGYTNRNSACERIRRFLKNVRFCESALAQFIAQITGLYAHEKWIVVLDRTYWMFGKVHLNFLYLSVTVGEFCIPIFFMILVDKKGHSSFEERKTILEKFTHCFSKDRIHYIVGDREFIGEDWLLYLQKAEIPFVQRIRAQNMMITNSRQESVKAFSLFWDLSIGEVRSLGMRFIGLKKNLHLQVDGLKTPTGDFVIVVSYKVHAPLDCYRMRWQIEVSFRTLKSCGFHIEDSHVRDPKRLTTLFQIVHFAFAVCVKIGRYCERKKSRKIKKHGYYAMTLVRYALLTFQPYILKLLRKKKSSKQNFFLKLVG